MLVSEGRSVCLLFVLVIEPLAMAIGVHEGTFGIKMEFMNIFLKQI